MAALRPVRRLGAEANLAVAVLLAALITGMLLSGAEALEKWGPFRGRVVDVETGEPIAGVAVLVAWFELVFNPVHTTQKFYDARETVTDADGRFEVARRSPPFFEFRIRAPEIMLFAPGYQEVSESVTPREGQSFVDPTEIRMRPLKTRTELYEKSRSRPTMVPDEHMPGFLKAINVERKMLGLGQIGPAPKDDR